MAAILQSRRCFKMNTTVRSVSYSPLLVCFLSFAVITVFVTGDSTRTNLRYPTRSNNRKTNRLKTTARRIQHNGEINIDHDSSQERRRSRQRRVTTSNSNSNSNIAADLTTATCAREIQDQGLSQTAVVRAAIASKLAISVWKFHDDPYYATMSTSTGTSITTPGGPVPGRTPQPYGFYHNRYAGEYAESDDGVDAIYTLRIDDAYCAVAFRGLELTRGWDVLVEDTKSNLEVAPLAYTSTTTSTSTTTTTTCDLHRGYYESYLQHQPEVEQFFDTCVLACPNCQLLITGGSQGGAIAQIAGLHLKDRYTTRTDNSAATTPNSITSTPKKVPYVITIGAPQALGGGCTELFTEYEQCRWYHYIMSTDSTYGLMGRGRVYDPIPMLFSQFLLKDSNTNNNNDGASSSFARNKGLAYVGHEFVLASDERTSLSYTGFNTHAQVDLVHYGHTDNTHRMQLYVDILEAHYTTLQHYQTTTETTTTICSIPTQGFLVGSVCNINENNTDDENTSSSTCERGSHCIKSGRWWVFGTQDSCQPIEDDGNNLNNGETANNNNNNNRRHRFCQ